MKLPTLLSHSSEVLVGSTGFSAQGIEITVRVRLGSNLEAWGKNSLQSWLGCCQNPVPCSYRSEVPISWLAVSWGLLSGPRGSWTPFSCGPLHQQSRNGVLNPPYTWNLRWLLVLPAEENSLLLEERLWLD